MKQKDRKSMLLSNVFIYTEETIISRGYLKIVDGLIESYGSIEELSADKKRVDKIVEFPNSYKLIPGLIDIHIHGAYNADVMDGTRKALEKMAATLPKEGTTSFLATTMTQEEQEIESALKNAAAYIASQTKFGMAEVLGVHLEGPFITSAKAGAQPLHAIKKPNVELFKKWQNIAGNHIKLVTLAPEEENGLDLVAYLKETGVVASMGHTDALYEDVLRGIEAGVSHVTHLYNGMRGLHHRDPGVAGAALLHKELLIEMIVDGIHIHPQVVNLTYQQKGKEGIVLITDSMRAKWMDDGVSSLGGQKVIVKDGKALLENGSLAGSTLKMDEGVRNIMNYTGCSLEDAVYMGSYNPAKQLGILHKKGSIKKGKDADLAILNKDNEVVMTICNGEIAYNKLEEM
ncbi:N-acetylglucosamine-6-phosphate deacetylase [Niallia nealsonii]|uniref:N-acetylglucosamine-6-phosphate deacetylase n=1 Tax=Niallia nealsonii TaxID=115979 RepID=A0A2N0Z803_9BACI|nr:N-acetylglucosamine-6-phosphate deacetylase [Niallia nealsonii]PKG25613.1 N-acetylglucosamine-6-phosphate deacetylase [Niallia nealsonii]